MHPYNGWKGTIIGFKLSDGVRYSIGTATAAAITVSGISNADPAIVSATAHGLAAKAPFILASGWEDINDSVYRVGASPLAGSFALEGVDTLDTALYSPGAGGGSLIPITTWTEIPQIIDASPSGGEQQFADVELLSQKYGIKIPTRVSGAAMEFTLATDEKLPAWKVLAAVSKSNKPVAIRKMSPGGTVSYGYGYFYLSPMSQDQKGNVQKSKASLTTMRPFVTFDTV